MAKDNNPKNEKWNTYKLTVESAISWKANTMYEDLEYADEHIRKYFLASAIRFVANIVSVCTCGIAFYLGLNYIFDWRISAFVSVLGAIGYEWLKNDTWKTTAKYVLKYGNISLYMIGIIILIHIGSFGGSLFGAWQTSNLMPEEVIGVAKLIDIDSLNATHDKRMAVMDQQINAMEDKKENDYHSRVAQAKLVVQKDTLVAIHKRAVAKAEAKNALLLIQYNNNVEEVKAAAVAKKEDMRETLLVVALVSEVLIFLCSLFISYYLFRKWVDDNPEEWAKVKQNKDKATTEETEITNETSVLKGETLDETKTKQTKSTESEQIAAKTTETTKTEKRNRISFQKNKPETKKTFVWNGKEYPKHQIKSMMRTAEKRANAALESGKTEVYQNNNERFISLKKVLNG